MRVLLVHPSPLTGGGTSPQDDVHQGGQVVRQDPEWLTREGPAQREEWHYPAADSAPGGAR